DTETRLHVHRVQTIALTLARAAGVGEADLEAVRLGALVHDVGKIAVPDGILTKPDKLTPEEFAKMQEHVIIGALILEPVPFGGPVVEAVRSHHERWDGNGYPDQLKGNQIPLSGRIIAIADVFDALTSDRPYRKAIPWDRAVEIMKRESGSHFDPMLLERFCEVLPEIRTGLEALEQSEDAAADSDVPGHLRALPGRVFDQIARAGQDSLLGAFQFVEQIVRDQSPENLTAALLQLRVHVPWDAAVVYDLDREREELRPRIALGLHETELHRVRIRLDEGISGRVASTGSPLVNKPAIRDIGAVLDVSENVELTSTLSVPVLHRDQIISVLTLYASAHAIYRDEHLRLLEAVARQLGHEWADRAVVNDLGPVALDPATGVHSVRALVERLEQELPISQQAERMLALVYLDLRQPWRSAQRQQLGLGDRLVEPITQALRECVRKEDMICRAGEAEFLLLLANAGSHDAAAFTRRASLAVEAVLDQFEISADFRTGTALFPHDGKSFAGLRAAAEAACETWRTEARAVAA
ncbi:MAG: HD domain-containing protein, partial [Armatimonadetes bacterium]|nr:HD domain-containing protein [Armatimonadota bacterium]